MEETELRKHRCCFTGHRPEKLKVAEDIVISELQAAIEVAIEQGMTDFISGMAKGVDIWAAEIVARLKSKYPTIRLVCAVPYPGFGLHWKNGWTERFEAVLKQADSVYYISPHYSPRVFQIRNQWMVDHATLLIAAYNGAAGGTKNILDYASHDKECSIMYLPSMSNETNE